MQSPAKRKQRPGIRLGRAIALAVAFAVAAIVVPAIAAPPRPGDHASSKLPPPPEGGDVMIDDAPPAQDIDLHEQRMHEFNEHLVRAQAAQQRERHDEAIREYTAALRLQHDDPQALLGRALARNARTPDGRCPTGAIRDLTDLGNADPKGQYADERQVLIGWMGRCGSKYARRRMTLARELAAEEPGARGRPDDIRVTLAVLLEHDAGDDTTLAESDRLKREALHELELYARETERRGAVPIAVGLRLQADLYRELDELQKAAALYDRLIELHPTAAAAQDAANIREELSFEVELDKLDKTQGFRPTPRAQAAYDRGLHALQRGDHATAESELSSAIEESPWFPQAYYARGKSRARAGRFLQAVDDLKRAARMDRSDYQARIALGLIYKKEFAGAEDTEAIKHLSAALLLRPDLHRLHLLLGELHARTDRQKARDHYEAFLRAAALDDPDARSARKALEDLEREIRREEPPPIQPPAEAALRFLEPELQRMINEAYLRGTEHQDWELAEKILLEARDRFPEEPGVLNELARVVYHQDRLQDAEQYWEQSLSMREEQVEVHERLGLLLRDAEPDVAIPHLQRAADLGSFTARFVLASLLWDQTKPFQARDQLGQYLSEASVYDLHWERAQALKREIDGRFLQFYIAAGLMLAIAIAVPAWRVWRLYRGASLRQLLERAPKSFPEVARILSLIRHEILKHNTAFLVDVGRALERETPDALHRAEVLGHRLFGDAGSDQAESNRAAGIYGRFLGYLDDLEKVGRAHQVNLNLHRKDPIFQPMIEAFEALARRASAMRAPTRLGSRKRIALARTLRRTGEVLGRSAFEKLSGLIAELCVTHVDAPFVHSVYEQVRGEKPFEHAAMAPLVLTGAGAPVRIFRSDLEDILSNVIRNSLRSSLRYANPPIGLGIDMVAEFDEITGLGSIAIRIKDRSPEQLSNEMLRGRYVERGMGITVDLLSRYDGAIAVETEVGWSKAVVLRFFILEDESVAREAEAAA